MAIAETRPAPLAVWLVTPELIVDAGPSAVHWPCDCGLFRATVKMRKLTCVRSATSSPRPVELCGLPSVRLQLFSVPLFVGRLSTISKVQSPPPGRPASESLPLKCCANASCGVKVPKKGAPPLLINVVALSSKTVLLKLACVPDAPTPLKRTTRV